MVIGQTLLVVNLVVFIQHSNHAIVGMQVDSAIQCVFRLLYRCFIFVGTSMNITRFRSRLEDYQ